MKHQFALIGAGGYVAPRHMKAIRDIGGELVVAYDPNDSVGIMDSYFPDAHFFVEFERFDRHVDKIRRQGQALDYISICSPNYLHDAHCRFALRSSAHAICEKPLVLNPWNIDGLADIERSTGKSISTILQLRLHPAIVALRGKVRSTDRRHRVVLTYVTSRGRWYHASWKGDEAKSGGVATNIGVHFFDMLTHIFGGVRGKAAHLRERDRAAGFIDCERADISWYLSVDRRDLPPDLAPGQSTFRSVKVDDEEIEFSEGFADLHTTSYREIVAGRGFTLSDVRASIEIVSDFRTAALSRRAGELHQAAQRHLACAP